MKESELPGHFDISMSETTSPLATCSPALMGAWWVCFGFLLAASSVLLAASSAAGSSAAADSGAAAGSGAGAGAGSGAGAGAAGGFLATSRSHRWIFLLLLFSNILVISVSTAMDLPSESFTPIFGVCDGAKSHDSVAKLACHT